MGDPDEIRNWQRLDARTTTSGALTPENIAQLADIGVTHVINLVPDGNPGALEGEAELLANRGIRYSYIPVPFNAPTDEHYRAFRDAIESDNEPVHAHCAMNYRVSAFFYRYNIESRGMDMREARAIMEKQWSPEEYEHGTPWVNFIENEK